MNFKPTPEQIDEELRKQRFESTKVPKLSSFNVYVLKLQHDCYYVGISKHVHWRVGNHIEGKGAAWTRLHHVIDHIDTYQCYTSDERKALSHEDRITVQYMRRYGWKKVRGGQFCDVDEHITAKKLRRHDLLEQLEHCTEIHSIKEKGA